MAEHAHTNKNLSERQQQVLTLLGSGLSKLEIGQTLLITENMVKSHVSHIMSVLQTASRMHCVVETRHLGLLV